MSRFGGARGGLPCAQRKADGRDARGRARSCRAREGRRAHPRRRAEPPLSRGRPPHRAGAALRRDRRDHQRSCRFLPRAAFRRLSRGDGSCPAARHGDPRLRRPALHDRIGRVGRLLPRMESAAFLVSAGLVGGGDLRTRERRRLRLSRLLVRAGPGHVLGMRVALRRRERRADLGRGRSDPDRGSRRRRRATACSTR